MLPYESMELSSSGSASAEPWPHNTYDHTVSAFGSGGIEMAANRL